MRPVLILLALAAAAVAAAGCHRGGGPDCAAVGERAVELIRAEIRAEPDADASSAMESMLGPLKDGIVGSCEGEDWSERDRECFTSARALDEAHACVGR